MKLYKILILILLTVQIGTAQDITIFKNGSKGFLSAIAKMPNVNT